MFCKEMLKLCLAISVVVMFTACGQKDVVTFTASPLETERISSPIEENVCVTDSQKQEKESVVTMTPKVQTATEEKLIFIHVCGAVCTPGVYEVSKEARVFDAIEKAGGCREDASEESLNLAQLLTDGQRIYVPTKEEVAKGLWQGQQPAKTESSGQETVTLVNINTAGKEELMTLPGIGEAKAESILLYRQENGSFGTIEEIKQISGIKNSVFEKLKDRITV